MPDGKRKRRNSPDSAKRLWYATYRSYRFGCRFGAGAGRGDLSAEGGAKLCGVVLERLADVRPSHLRTIGA